MTAPSTSVGILSDTHGYLDPRVAETVNRCDHIIHAGDIMGAHILAALDPKIQLHAVAGNNDHAAIWGNGEADIVNALPSTTRLDLPGGRLSIEHGHRLGGFPDHDQLRRDHGDARVIVYGHTHKRVIDTRETPWVVNPGAAGRVRTKGGPSCLLLQASESGWQIDEIVFPDDVSAHETARRIHTAA